MNNVLIREDLKETDFQKLFRKVQKHMATYHADVLQNLDAKEQMKNHIRKYLIREKMKAEGRSIEETIEMIWNEMAEFSVLTPYLDPERTDVEEINVNRYDDVKVSYSDGSIKPAKHFVSPKHCEDIIRRLLNRESTLVLDKSRPIVRGHLNSRIRITVMGEGIIDKEAGIAASLRIVNPKKLKKEDFVEKGTATESMIILLETLFQNRTSMCITGETGSGKTTLMSYLLTTIPYEKRVFTIEEDVREFNLVVKDVKGNVLNNVVHTTTKKSEDPTKEISQDNLLETAMTMDPDIICVAEMKGREALSAQEAANTGHTVITTTHANSCRATYARMADLCQAKTSMSKEALLEMAQSAFPIVVYIKKYKDHVRRIKEITECTKDENGNTNIVTLYRYKNGKFEKKNNPSEHIRELLEEEEVPQDIMDSIFGEVQ